MIRQSILLCSIAFALSGCATDRGPREAEIPGIRERVSRKDMPRLKPVGDPTRVAATDIAFARMARDQGQWTAFAEYSAPGAQLHGRNGPIEARPWLAAQQNPPVSVRWAPTAVWSSCDGSLAVSFGRSLDPEGIVGSYATVWQLQDDRTYRWIYDGGTPDNPQPPPRPADVVADKDTIVVDALTAIDGRVADCPRGGGELPAARIPILEEGTREGGGESADRTLNWRWEHQADGTRRVVVRWLRDGAWQQALDFSMAPQ